jgi:hypothetical protein
MFVFALAGVSGHAVGGLIHPGQTMLEVLPGSQVRVLWIVDDVSAPLFGYSLDLNLVSSGLGSVTANDSESNFFESRNLIVAGGRELDPLFSVINSDGLGGLFLSTNTSDFSSVIATSGVNDVLAEIVFDVSEDASGEFVFDLASGTALSDSDGFPVAFDQVALSIHVVPAPLSALPIGAVGLLSIRRRRSNANAPRFPLATPAEGVVVISNQL